MGLVLLIICALVATSAGIAHAMLKNKQLQVVREIEKVQGRIGDLELDIATEGMRISSLTDRYELRSALEQIESELQPIASSQLEEVDLSGQQHVASHLPYFQ